MSITLFWVVELLSLFPLCLSHKSCVEKMSNYEDDNVLVPMAIRTELLRLASILGLESDENLISSDDCLNLLDETIRSVERLKYESTDRQTNSHTKTKESTTDKPSKKELKLATQAKSLEDDLRLSIKSFESGEGMKNKLTQQHNQIRKEKQQRQVLEKFIESQNRKISILVTHIDKLMKALKREASKTIRSAESNRQLEKTITGLNQKLEKQARVISVQNRYVSEIAEGSRILQDQLALMDEKYLELRNRLDTSRKQFGTQMDKIAKECSQLRLKYSMATHGKLLDTIPISNGNWDSGDLDGSRPKTSSGHGKKPRAKSARAALSHSHSMNPIMRTHTNDSSGGEPRYGYSDTLSRATSPKRKTILEMSSNAKEDIPYDVGQYQDEASNMFLAGLTRNHQFQLHPDPEVAEKHILKKINQKVKKSEYDGWTPEQLQELLKKS